jgi:dihydroorotate dehydrogenase (fumarate)
MIDLTTKYLGLTLKNPLVASAGPVTANLDALGRLEAAGVGAAVLPSLFEEEIEHEEMEIHRLYEYETDAFAESLTHFPELEMPATGPTAYLDRLTQAKRLLNIPVIASLNGSSVGGWTRYAKQIEDAGADALELNIYFVPTDPRATAADVENRYLDLVAAIRAVIRIPIAVKIGSQFSSLPHFAAQLAARGANGLVLFNRYLEPDIDLERLEIEPDLVLSSRHELRLPLRWIAILRDQLDVSLAATSGVHTWEDALKALLVGADVAMSTTALLRKGPEYVRALVTGLEMWMSEREYTSIEQLKGSMSRGKCADPGALERANYMKALIRFTSEYFVPPAAR